LRVPISAGVADAEIVLGVLIEIFRGDGVAADRGFPREREISLTNLIGATADLNVGAVAVEGVISLRLLVWPVPS
jgi:hypothetical protein